jgi:hypothetical protein
MLGMHTTTAPDQVLLMCAYTGSGVMLGKVLTCILEPQSRMSYLTIKYQTVCLLCPYECTLRCNCSDDRCSSSLVLCFITSVPYCVRSCLAILSQEDHNGNKSQTLLCVILHDFTHVHVWLFKDLCAIFIFIYFLFFKRLK